MLAHISRRSFALFICNPYASAWALYRYVHLHFVDCLQIVNALLNMGYLSLRATCLGSFCFVSVLKRHFAPRVTFCGFVSFSSLSSAQDPICYLPLQTYYVLVATLGLKHNLIFPSDPYQKAIFDFSEIKIICTALIVCALCARAL